MVYMVYTCQRVVRKPVLPAAIAIFGWMQQAVCPSKGVTKLSCRSQGFQLCLPVDKYFHSSTLKSCTRLYRVYILA